MHKYSSKVANVDSMGCLRRQGNTDYPKYACGAVPYWKGKYKSYILHVYWFKHILQLHGTWNWFLMFNIMCFPRNSLDSAMLWSSHTYTVVTSARRATWMKQIGRKCGEVRTTSQQICHRGDQRLFSKSGPWHSDDDGVIMIMVIMMELMSQKCSDSE